MPTSGSEVTVWPSTETVMAPTTTHSLRDQIHDILTTLTDRERRVLELRFGIADGRVWTLEEIGNELHVTRERIRQIERKALTTLRRAEINSELRAYLV